MPLTKWMFYLFTNQVAGFYYFVNINIQITNVRQETFVFCLRHVEKNGGDKIPLPLENTGKLNVTKKKKNGCSAYNLFEQILCFLYYY